MFELWSDNFKEIKTYSLFLCASEAKKKKKSIERIELIRFCLSTLSLFPYSRWLNSAAGSSEYV